MITVKFKDTNNCNMRTYSPGMIGAHGNSGWTIDGEIIIDYYQWLDTFTATHPTLGTVKGDFCNTVEATSAEALAHLLKFHPYEEWDSLDI